MLLEVDVEKRFPNFTSSVQFSLDCERCGVFGPSGSGKSTLMHMLAGLTEPDRGIIRLNNKTLFTKGDNNSRKINLPPEKRNIGVVFQHALLFPHMNVEQNLYYGFKRLQDKASQPIDKEQLLTVLQLERLLDRSVTRLSGGEKQRVALGRTILACPDLILLDEPLSGLDQRLKYQIIPYLKNVFDTFKIPMLFISHSQHEMQLMADTVIIFDQGSAKEQLSTEELARQHLTRKGQGYANLLELGNSKPYSDLYAYDWGGIDLILTEKGERGKNMFELDARDIILCKENPRATSARNLLSCRVSDIFSYGNRVGVELDCGGGKLVAQVVPESVDELAIGKGVELTAMIKASSFRPLY
jgi:molybdate transport system ATP-binding protein